MRFGWPRASGGRIGDQPPASYRRKLLRVGLGVGEQVAHIGDSPWEGSDRPAIRPQVRVVELVPGDGRAHRRAFGGPNRVRRDERLDARVLGVVEAGTALAGF